MNNVAIVIPWYGEIPRYFSLFLKGLEFNKNVLDVLFFTDLKVPDNLPANLKVIHFPWEDLVCRLKKKIHPEINITKPYKLCDLKPMYGKIFEEELSEYSYWGYGDIDLIYGNLKIFMPFDGIEKYDVITFRENVMYGPLSIFKNSEYMRNLYLKTNQLDKVIGEPNYIGFDEAGRRKPWRSRVRLYNYIDIDNFWDWSCIIQHEADHDRLILYERYYCLEYILYNCILHYSKGALNIGMEEYALFHIVDHKKTGKFYIPNWGAVPDSFFITNTGFYKYNDWYLLKKCFRILLGQFLKWKKRVVDSYNFRVKKRR